MTWCCLFTRFWIPQSPSQEIPKHKKRACTQRNLFFVNSSGTHHLPIPHGDSIDDGLEGCNQQRVLVASNGLAVVP